MCFMFVLILVSMVLGFVSMCVVLSVLFYVSYVWVWFVGMWCSGCVGFCLICDACSWRCSLKGRVCVSSCRCCVFVSVVHPVAILSAVLSVVC